MSSPFLPADFKPEYTVLTLEPAVGDAGKGMVVFYVTPKSGHHSWSRMFPKGRFAVIRWDGPGCESLVCTSPNLPQAKLYIQWVALYRARAIGEDFASWAAKKGLRIG